jgi:P-type Ca2+ transporter type 2C
VWQVNEGSGKCLVIAVGTNSEWGRTMAVVSESGSDQTPLQEKLSTLAGSIGKVRPAPPPAPAHWQSV